MNIINLKCIERKWND